MVSAGAGEGPWSGRGGAAAAPRLRRSECRSARIAIRLPQGRSGAAKPLIPRSCLFAELA
jgi:hypothetical protein